MKANTKKNIIVCVSLVLFSVIVAHAGEPALIAQIDNINSGNALSLYGWVKSNHIIAKDGKPPKWAKEYYVLKLRPIEFVCYELSATSQKSCEIQTFSSQYFREGFISFSVDGSEKNQQSFIQWVVKNSEVASPSLDNRSLVIDSIVISCTLKNGAHSGTCDVRKK